MRLSIYLAGPEVFLPDAVDVGMKKTAICSKYGFIGKFPLDAELKLKDRACNEVGARGESKDWAVSEAIYDANCQAIEGADILIANMTPFRGPSMDVGTAFEMGYAKGLDKPVMGYSNDHDPYLIRVQEWDGMLSPFQGQSEPIDSDGLLIERFGLSDNLMLVHSAHEHGMRIITNNRPDIDRYRDLSAFEACVEMASKIFSSDHSPLTSAIG